MNREESIRVAMRIQALELELAAAREQVSSRNKRLADMARELEQEKQDRKQADLDTIRAMGERNDARAALMLAAQWGILSDGFSAEVSGAIRAWIINGMKGPPPAAPDHYPRKNQPETYDESSSSL